MDDPLQQDSELSGNFCSKVIDGRNTKPVQNLYIETKRDFYVKQLRGLKTYFRKNNFLMAESALGLLIKEKASKKRKDGVTPDYAHEIDHVMEFKNALENGTINPDNIGKNMIELIFTNKILHDIGEDFGYWHKNIVKSLDNRIDILSKGKAPEKYRQMVREAAHYTELLTHYRKFKRDEMLNHFDNIDIPVPQGTEMVRLPEIEEKVRPLFAESGCDTDNLHAMVINTRNKQGIDKPTVIVGRHGMPENMDIFNTFEGSGQDWNSYGGDNRMDLFMRLLKKGDRINGMATRICMVTSPDNLTEYGKYLARTRLLFVDTVLKEEMEEERSSPFSAYFASQEAMMGILDRIGRMYIEHHPYRASGGKVGFSAHNLEYIKFYDFLPKAMEAYRGLDPHHHPIVQILKQINEQIPEIEKINQNKKDGMTGIESLYHSIVTSLIKDGGDEVKELIYSCGLIGPELHKDIELTCTV